MLEKRRSLRMVDLQPHGVRVALQEQECRCARGRPVIKTCPRTRRPDVLQRLRVSGVHPGDDAAP